MVLRALDAGVPRILLEKPAVPFLGQLDRLIDADQHRRVRVGFQLLHWKPLLDLKAALLDGRLGSVRAIRVAASWPRGPDYYSRNRWAGRMFLNGEPVFDGPATNALSHLIQNVAFLLGSDASGFGTPSRISGCLVRALPIDSYDTALIAAEFGEVRADFFFTHAWGERVPYEIRVEGTKGSATLREQPPFLIGPGGTSLSESEGSSPDKGAMYRAFSAPQDRYAEMIPTLADTRPFTLITNGALHSSDGIHKLPAQSQNDSGTGKAADILESAMEAFWSHPGRLPEILQIPPGEWVEAANIPASSSHGLRA